MTSLFIAVIYSTTIALLPSLMVLSCLAQCAGKPVVVSSIFLSKSGDDDKVETFDCDSNKLKDAVSYISIVSTYDIDVYIMQSDPLSILV